MFQQRVVPVLAEAELAFDLYVTKHVQLRSGLCAAQRCVPVARGGCGWRRWDCLRDSVPNIDLVYNGLLEREDWQKALNEVPVGVIPCGSGNGLAKSISHSVE
ncbi:unnamed protein product, partial [Timema podura]|nr:unnamed protein product [Timema podura]